jgi:hypothetical protein
VREFSPDIMAHAIHGKMKTTHPDGPRFSEIDAVLYISEKHIQLLPDGRPSAALLIYEGAAMIDRPWKVPVVNRVVGAWSRLRSGAAPVENGDLYSFKAVHDIPDRARRSEAWQIEYQRNPHLREISLADLKFLFHRSMAVNSLTFLKGNWPQPAREETARGLREFQHVIEEINRRGIDMRTFSFHTLSPRRQQAVWKGLPAELVKKLKMNPINFGQKSGPKS